MSTLISPSISNDLLSLESSDALSNKQFSLCDTPTPGFQNEFSESTIKPSKKNIFFSKYDSQHPCTTGNHTKQGNGLIFEEVNVEDLDNVNETMIKKDEEHNQNNDGEDFFNVLPNQSISDILMLLIQKECEIVCLRSELQIYKEMYVRDDTDNTLKQQFPDKENLVNLPNHNENHENESKQKIIESGTSLKSPPAKSNVNHGENDDIIGSKDLNKRAFSIQETVIDRERPDSIDFILQNEACKIPEISGSSSFLIGMKDLPRKTQMDEIMELERKKVLLHEQELYLQKERNSLEDLRNRLEWEKKELEKSRAKLEEGLRKILDDAEDMDYQDSERNHGRLNELNYLTNNKAHMIGMAIESTATENSTPTISIYENSSVGLSANERENGIFEQKTATDSITFEHVLIDKKDQNETEKPKEIEDECEDMFNRLYEVMDSWKTDVIKQTNEAKMVINDECQNNENLKKHLPSIEIYRQAVSALKQEYKRIKEVESKIEKNKEALAYQEKHLESWNESIKEKERLMELDKIEIERMKKYLNREWEHLTSDMDNCKENKIMIENEGKKLEELRNNIKRERRELKEMKIQYEEEKKLSETIRQEVDGKRMQEILLQQKCMEEKWKELLDENQKLSMSWRQHAEEKAILELNKNCIFKEHEVILVERKQLEREKLSLEKDKVSFEERSNQLEEEWNKFQSKKSELDKELIKIEKMSQVFAQDWDIITSEKLKLNEIKQSLEEKENKMKAEIILLEENKRMMSEKIEKLEHLTKDSDTMWANIEKQRKMCQELLLEQQRRSNEQLDGENTKNAEERAKSSSFDPEHLQQRILKLVNSVIRMEKDALEIKMKMDEKARLQRKIRIMKKKMKMMKKKMHKASENMRSMKDQTSSFQEKIRRTNVHSKNELDLESRFHDSYEGRFIKRTEDIFIDLRSYKKHHTRFNNEKQSYKDVKTFRFHERKHFSEKIGDIIIKGHYDQAQNKKVLKNRLWLGNLHHQSIAAKNLQRGTFDDQDTFSYINGELNPQTKNRQKDCILQKRKLRISSDLRKKIEAELQLQPCKTHLRPDVVHSPRSKTLRAERNVWDIAFLAIMLLGCGVPSLLLPLSFLPLTSTSTTLL